MIIQITNQMNTENKPKRTFTNKRVNNNKIGVKKALERTPEHVRNLVYLVINNAEIRRFTSLGIINRMKQKGFVNKEAKCYVDFYPNKYSVSVNGLKTEYHYNNSIFINSLAASFPSFAFNANKIIQTFIEAENAELNENDVNDIVEAIKDNANSPVEGE